MAETAEAVEVEKAEKLEGFKESATNPVALEEVKTEATPAPAEEALPSFFIDPVERHRINIDITFETKSGKLLTITQAIPGGLNLKGVTGVRISNEWFEFTQPTYDDISLYRQRCSNYNDKIDRVVVDGIAMRRFFIAWHLKDWSLKDKHGKKMELKHRGGADSSLDDESLQKVFTVFPAIMDVALTLFEKSLMLT